MAEKRRLPVLANPKPARPAAGAAEAAKAAEEEDEPRPPWHWVVLGVVLTFAAWLPLAWLATAFSRAVTLPKYGFAANEDPGAILAALPDEARARVGLALAAPQALGAALAAFGGGFVIARFGRGVRLRETLALGVAVSALAIVPTLRQGAMLAVIVLAFCVLCPSAVLGGVLGHRKQGKISTSNPL